MLYPESPAVCYLGLLHPYYQMLLCFYFLVLLDVYSQQELHGFSCVVAVLRDLEDRFSRCGFVICQTAEISLSVVLLL